MNTIPILLDTDIGSDIDDAVALAYLLRQPRCELLGITTVTGRPATRAMLADVICRAAGRMDMPIHVGLETPLLISPMQPDVPHSEALVERNSHRAFAAEPTAIDFLRETIRDRPGEMTLLAIGPLTNIAVLFSLDPEIPRLLKSLVIMGGWFFDRPAPEWNIAVDPHAAAIVFNAPVANMIAVGIDVTRYCQLPADECRTRFAAAGGRLEPVAAMAEVWFRGRPTITFHDPLASALIFEPGLCGMEAHKVAVDVSCGPNLGLTRPSSEVGRPTRQLAATVDTSDFFNHYFDVVGR